MHPRSFLWAFSSLSKNFTPFFHSERPWTCRPTQKVESQPFVTAAQLER